MQSLIHKRRLQFSTLLPPIAEKDALEASLATLRECHCHPLLFATLVAICLVNKTDVDDYLNQFINGHATAPIEANYLRIEEVVGPSSLTGIIELESEILHDLAVISYDQMLGMNNLSYRIIEAELNRMLRLEMPRDVPANVHILRHQVWLELNIALTAFPSSAESISWRLRNFGRKGNTEWWNYYYACRGHLNHTKIEMNECLKRPGADLSQGRLMYKTAQKLVERAARFYRWNPEEIAAHIQEELFMRSIEAELYAKDRLDSDDTKTLEHFQRRRQEGSTL